MTRFLAPALLLLATASAAQAQTQSLSPASRQAVMQIAQACRQDMATLCPGIQPGGGRVMACFRQHPDQLSSGCRQAMAEALPALRQARAGAGGAAAGN